MAKRSRSKPSRHERKQQRVKSARATDHGLPQALPRTRTSRLDPNAAPADVEPASSDLDDLAEGGERRRRSLSQRIHDVSLPVKIAIVAAVALAVIWVFAFTGGRDVSRPAPVSSVSAQPTASALPVVSTKEPTAPAPTVSAEAPPVVPTVRATAPRKTAEPAPAPEEQPPVSPDPSASASAKSVKPASDTPPRPTERPGPPSSLSGAAKPLEPPPFVTPPPPAPPLPSTHPEPDPLGEGKGRPDVGDP